MGTSRCRTVATLTSGGEGGGACFSPHATPIKAAAPSAPIVIFLASVSPSMDLPPSPGLVRAAVAAAHGSGNGNVRAAGGRTAIPAGTLEIRAVAGVSRAVRGFPRQPVVENSRGLT